MTLRPGILTAVLLVLLLVFPGTSYMLMLFWFSVSCCFVDVLFRNGICAHLVSGF